MSAPVRQRDRQALLAALRAGVVPSRGLEHIQVGRVAEVEALTRDIRQVKSGGTAARFIVGDYGTGKSFFLQVIRQAAHRANCVTMNADLSQNSRLYGTSGRVRSLITGLVGSTATKSQPEKGALLEILEGFTATCRETASRDQADLVRVATRALSDLRGFQGGAQFVDVVVKFTKAVRDDDQDVQAACLRWFQAEYRLRGEAKSALGVNGIIGDADLYPTLRLFAVLVRRAGYGGLVVQLDEMGVLARYNRATRDQQYEEVLTMINDLHSGHAEGLGIFFAGSTEFVQNQDRGLYSYGALRSRLARNEFLRPGMVDTAGPVISLQPFAGEDLVVLMENVHRVFCSNGQKDPISDERAFTAFLEHAASQLGGLAHVTPREATKQFVQFLDALDQNRGLAWSDVLDDVEVQLDEENEMTAALEVADEQISALPTLVSTAEDGLDDFAGFSLEGESVVS